MLLKDIFPQNAVDMKLMSDKSVLYKYFRKKEKELYMVSDKIGCMSEANVQFVLKNNSFIEKDKIEVNPNSIQIFPLDEDKEEQRNIRSRYEIPFDRKIFIYGGI